MKILLYIVNNVGLGLASLASLGMAFFMYISIRSSSINTWFLLAFLILGPVASFACVYMYRKTGFLLWEIFPVLFVITILGILLFAAKNS